MEAPGRATGKRARSPLNDEAKAAHQDECRGPRERSCGEVVSVQFQLKRNRGSGPYSIFIQVSDMNEGDPPEPYLENPKNNKEEVEGSSLLDIFSEVDGHHAMQVVFMALEECVLLDAQENVKVAIGTAVRSGLAFAAQA